MNEINPGITGIRLQAVVDGTEAWGPDEGAECFQKTAELIREKRPRSVTLDFEGLARVDSSWCREAVCALVNNFRGRVAFLVAGTNKIIEENLDTALLKQGMSMLCRRGEGEFVILGAALKPHLIETLEIAEARKEVTTTDLCRRMPKLSLQNCNNRLRQLVEIGLLIRMESAAVTGGKEFVYRSIG